MDRLWGECVSVPEDNLEILAGGERIDCGGRTLQVAYTPGHASHHVSYHDLESGIAFIGDVGGGRIRGGAIVLPATPPPDIDPETIVTSFKLVAEWNPERLFVTHFGLADDIEEHGRKLTNRLEEWTQHVRESLQTENSDAARSQRFADWVGEDLRRTLSEEDAVTYEYGAPPGLSWYGLARYWRKRSVSVC